MRAALHLDLGKFIELPEAGEIVRWFVLPVIGPDIQIVEFAVCEKPGFLWFLRADFRVTREPAKHGSCSTFWGAYYEQIGSITFAHRFSAILEYGK